MGERFTPKMYVEWYAKKEGLTIEEFGVAPTVVISWRQSWTEQLVNALDARLPKARLYGERYPIYTGQHSGNQVSVVTVPVGAPGTVMMMEELIVCGARRFIGIGLAGSLQGAAPIGSFVVPTSVVSEEGTSSHYATNETAVSPSPQLVKILKDSCREENVGVATGRIWTTDAPYRESVSKIEKFHKLGVLGVDMETSAMYALGHAREVQVCNLLIVSDELWHEWRPAFGTQPLRTAIEKAQQVVLRSISRKDLGD